MSTNKPLSLAANERVQLHRHQGKWGLRGYLFIDLRQAHSWLSQPFVDSSYSVAIVEIKKVKHQCCGHICEQVVQVKEKLSVPEFLRRTKRRSFGKRDKQCTNKRNT